VPSWSGSARSFFKLSQKEKAKLTLAKIKKLGQKRTKRATSLAKEKELHEARGKELEKMEADYTALVNNMKE